MLELWQTEWCPASQRVRQRLTELGVDYLIRQVPVGKDARHALARVTGATTIPALVFEGGEIAVGEETILETLATVMPETSDADAHRTKAANARRRYLEEECECSQPVTR